MKNLSESIMKNLKESADNDRIVKVRVDYADDSIELTEENIKKEIKKYLPNARIAVIHSKNGRWPEVEITDKYNDLKSYISDIYLGGFDEDRDIDDFLVESVSRNSRKVSKNVNARRIKESENLTARVTYHSEDGTRDYIAGRLSDGRYFLISQQEQITVSDKDLPKLAKKDMDDFRYDEDGDREFIEALENGTKLDKNSDLAKIIINASRKHLDDGCYLLSESAKLSKSVSRNLSTKSRRKAKKLNEGEKYSYITGANDYEDVYNSEANTDVLFILKELERYFNESSEFVKNVMSTDEAINYKFPSGEANMLKQSADKIAEVRNTIDKWYSEKY